jgi:kynurenine formamidase
MDHALVPGGRKSATIDEVPLDWCLQPGVKLDFRRFPAGYVATAEDVARELDRIGHALAPLDIVLVNTAAAARYGQPEYWDSHCGMGRQATLHLLERGVRVVGTDAWGWDAPFSITAERWRQTRDNAILWEGHKAGRDIGYFQMEKLTNLDQLPPHGFSVACFPLKVKGASAGWTRAVAILES